MLVDFADHQSFWPMMTVFAWRQRRCQLPTHHHVQSLDFLGGKTSPKSCIVLISGFPRPFVNAAQLETYTHLYIYRWLYMYVSSIYSGTLWHLIYRSLCAFCRVVVPTKPFTNTALYYKMLLESEPTPLATKCFWGFWWWIKSQCGSLQNAFA